MEDQIFRTDKRLRNQVIFGIVIFAALGILGIQWLSFFLDQIRQLRETDPVLANQKLISLLNIVSVVHGLVSVSFAAYFLLLGINILKGEKYPPEKMRVIKDTKVQIGNRARHLAYAHISIALLVLSTNIIVWRLRAILEKWLKDEISP